MTELDAEIVGDCRNRADGCGEDLQISSQTLCSEKLNTHLHELCAAACESRLVAVNRLFVIKSYGQQAALKTRRNHARDRQS